MLNGTKRISVVMTVYGEEPFLEEAIESVLQQTYSSFEFLIVVEHGAAEQTVNIVRYYAQKDYRIRIIFNDTRLGLAESLNVGIREAKGEYIARMDDDDISLPERFEKQLAFLDEKRQLGICGCLQATIRAGSEGVLYCATDAEELKGEMLFGCQLSHTSVMFRRRLFIENGWFYDGGKLAEDFDLWIRILADVGMANIDEVLVKHRYDVSNISLRKGAKLYHETIGIIQGGIEKYFGIPTDDWSEEVLCPWRKFPNYLKLAQLYRLIFETISILYKLECANRRTHLVDECIFAKVLMKRFLWMFGNITKRMGLAELSRLFSEYAKTETAETFKGAVLSILFRIGVITPDETDLEHALEKYVHIPAGHRIIVYGWNRYYRDLLRKYTKEKLETLYSVIGVVDMTGRAGEDQNLIVREEIESYDYDYILISNPSEYQEIKNSLRAENHIKGKIGLLAQIGIALSGVDEDFAGTSEYIVFGCGKYLTRRLSRAEQMMHICCICDNDSGQWGKFWENKYYCISPDELYAFGGPEVLIAVEREDSYRSIQMQLSERGIQSRHINEILCAEWLRRGFAYNNEELNRMRGSCRKRLLLLGVPEKGNLRVQAQTYSIQLLLQEQYPDRDVFVFEETALRKAFYFLLYMIRSIARKDDVILVQKNGSLANNVMQEEHLCAKIVEVFPENNLLFLPCTMSSKEEDFM